LGPFLFSPPEKTLIHLKEKRAESHSELRMGEDLHHPGVMALGAFDSKKTSPEASYSTISRTTISRHPHLPTFLIKSGLDKSSEAFISPGVVATGINR
jgi:hypothetical protein